MFFRRSFVLAIAAALACSPCAVRADADTFTFSEISKMSDALNKIPLRFVLVSANRMPTYDPIAHYAPKDVSAGRLQPEILIDETYQKVFNASSAPKEAQLALLSAAVLEAMDSGTAGKSFKDLYDAAARHDAALPADVADRYRERHDLANAMAQALTNNNFVMQVHVAAPGASAADASPDTRKAKFFSLVLGLMTPGAWQVVVNDKAAAKMPKYAPLVYYDGIDQGHALIALNSSVLRVRNTAPSWREVSRTSKLILPYLEAFIMATADLGLAGPAWKKQYSDATALDKRLPKNADPFKNRHAFAAPLAAELYAQIQTQP